MYIIKAFPFLQNNRFFVIFLCAGVGAILLSLLISCLLKSEGVYFAFLILLFSSSLFLFLCKKEEWEAFLLCDCVLLGLGGFGYLILFFFLFAGRVRAEKREKRARIVRKLEYVLPEEEYVRARLRTVFAGETEELEKRTCKLSYARELLSKIKAEALTVAERLEVEELGKSIALFTQKDRWTTEDISRANELFARILKLSGKYAI